LKHVRLALAASLSSMLSAGVLVWGLYKIGAFKVAPGWGLFLLPPSGGCASMVAAIWRPNLPADDGVNGGWLQRPLQLGLWVVAGMVAFVAGLGLLGLRPRHLRH